MGEEDRRRRIFRRCMREAGYGTHRKSLTQRAEEPDGSMILIYFDDNTIAKLPYTEHNETEVLKQMNRPKNKRLYIFGLEFSRVDKVEVVSKKGGEKYGELLSERAHKRQVAFHGEKSTAEVCEKEPRLIAYGTFNVYDICGKAYIYDHIGKKFIREPSRDHFIKGTAAEFPTTEFPHLIYVGTIKAMKIVAKRGVKVLNPRTMKYQTVSKTAKYSVVPDPEIHGGATLYSNEDLKRIAKEKGLVWG